MIPDKIYIRHYWMPGKLDDEWRLKPIEDEQCEEYIRKDALMEWLEGKMTVEGATEGIVGGYDLALKDVIKHIKSL